MMSIALGTVCQRFLTATCLTLTAALGLGCQTVRQPAALSTPTSRLAATRLELFECPHGCKVPPNEEHFFGFTGKGDPKAELEKLKRAEKFDPSAPAVFHHQAEQLARLKRYREAMECETRALHLKPGFADALNGRAYYRSLLKQPKELELGLEDVALALQLDDDPNYYDTRGCLLMNMGRLREAVNDFTIALRKTEGEEQFRHRIEALRKLGRDSEADADLKRLEQVRAEKQAQETVEIEQ